MNPQHWLSAPILRLVLIGVLMIVLMIPLGMISEVVTERAGRRAEAVAEITRSWGGPQQLVGPVIRATCVYESTTDERGWTQPSREILFLPERLAVSGRLASEERRRGIFAVPVYSAALKLEGS